MAFVTDGTQVYLEPSIPSTSRVFWDAYKFLEEIRPPFRPEPIFSAYRDCPGSEDKQSLLIALFN